MYQENILTLYRFRYLKWSLALVLTCIAFYVFYGSSDRPSGGTVIGYGLGTLGALLIVWLMCFGLRKRAYSSSLGKVQGWLSAHVFLGLALVVVVTLHAGFHFSWNVQTLTYILTLVVVASGIWGVGLYLSQPSQMNSLLNGKTLEQCGEALAELDRQSEKIAAKFDERIQKIIQASANSKIIAYPWQRYFGNHRFCKTTRAVRQLTKIYSHADATHAMPRASAEDGKVDDTLFETLYTLQLRRQLQLKQIRDYLRYKGWTEVWLMFHVPLSFGLLGALIAHTVSVFFYW